MKRMRGWWPAGLLVLAAAGCADSSSAAAKADAGEAREMPKAYHGRVRAPLTPGEDFPDLTVAGWLNGEPKPVAKDGPPAHVIDVWAPWSPHCKTFGPKLAALRDKFAPRGVQFVSVTDMPKGWVENYGKQNAIAWPSGYGLSHDVIGELGTVNSGAMLASPGYAVAPTIFVVGPDGKVRGTDERGRMTRTEAPDVVEKLAALIEKTLAEGGPAKPPGGS